MPTEQGILAFHKRCEDFYPADAVDADITQQRAWYDALCAAFDAPPPAGMVKEDDLVAERIPVRRYRPATVTTATRLFYIHGGGFVVGSLDSHDAICAEIAEAAGAELVSVDYRLSPEHVWPAAFDDCWAVLIDLLLEPHPVVVIGDSAGGNLAAGIVLKARDEGLKGIVGQALIYPGLGGDLVSGSYQDMAEAPGLSTADVAYYREIYQAPEDAVHAFPLQSKNLAGLPPAFITGAYFDPLRDDARAYAARLILSGVPVEYREEKQMIHAWLRARFMSEGARVGFTALCDAVRRMANP
ncbi:alpha/beta hydrolase fold domain-containing protein [Shinella kummerowiae]|uniref:Alpha/beta hydrolase fold domain-containing protein n=2 Tax=Shinella kummerowiae TaxID=417745 RepID=A0A6N8S5F8_9HYPH|nr:alpha/beta hydrolase fold domain-containing protein [Shinella kummerowiae]